MQLGALILETGAVFTGFLNSDSNHQNCNHVGEVVFNTSHTGYEEIATDPSYFSQIVIMTFPMQGNYGVDVDVWESEKFWIRGFISLDIQDSEKNSFWKNRLQKYFIPVLNNIDTRQVVLRLREEDAIWGAIVPFKKNNKEDTLHLIQKEKSKLHKKDWTKYVSVKEAKDIKGDKQSGPKIAVIDFGCKKNILRELKKRSSQIRIFPSSSQVEDIKKWNPDGILLSNGPGDPRDVKDGIHLVKQLIGWKFIFGICLGNQILAESIGASNYKLKFGHRGGNHPIQNILNRSITMVSQNHGYTIDEKTLKDKDIIVSHRNLNDQTVAGIYSEKKRFLGVQFHPENCPGPRDTVNLFDEFIKKLEGKS